MAKPKESIKCWCSCDECCCKGNIELVKKRSEQCVQPDGGRRRPFSIACEWDRNQTHQFSDDGTNTYFWKAHTITVLAVMLCVLVYVALFEMTSSDSQFNTKRGLLACVMVFLLFGVTQIRDSSFQRPHPAFWRLMLCFSILYELALIFILFQKLDDARLMLKYVDKSLGEPLPETLYCQACSFYTPGHPDGPFHNFMDKLDFFVFCHLVGWWAKALMIRDWWLSCVLSVLFEVLEYSLAHQLPNFCECWWDHWIMDVLICNGIGTYLGMKTCNYLAIKPFHWRGLYNIPSYRGKLKRVAEQFTPYSWTAYDWAATQSLKRWLGVCGLIAIYLVAEISLFYIKFILWIPPPHFINFMRVGLFLFCGSVSLNEIYDYMSNKECKRFGQQAWVITAIIGTEVLICFKFGWGIITLPFPQHIVIFWVIAIIVFVTWTVWHFWPSGISNEPRKNGKKANGKRD